MIYLLVVFAKSDKQEEFVEFVAEEISTVSNPDLIKYYFGEESIIFTFESSNNYKTLSKFVSDVFLGMDIVFFLTQYNPDEMLLSSQYNPDEMLLSLPSKIKKYLFENVENDDLENQINDSQITSNDDKEEMFNEFKKKLELISLEIDDDDQTLIKKDKKLTLNQLLDKINEVGLENMLEKELSLLNYYSNQF